MVLAKSPIAKEFGITTGEPIYFAKQKCNHLEIFPCNFSVYKKYSNNLYNLLLEYTDKIERFSIDECFMDLTGYLMKRDLLDIAKEINLRVEKEFGFTVNIGVAHNKLLAKMASDFEKPNKIHTLFEEEIKTKMWKLPISELFMLGKKTVPKLLNMQIKTIGDLAESDFSILQRKFGKHGKLIWEYANGIDNTEVNNKIEPPKSIGNSVTLPKDLESKEEIKEILIMLADQVSFRLRKQELIANTVNVQLRTNDFIDFSRQKKLPFTTANTKEIINTAKELLNEMYKGESIRLVGLRVDNLENKEDMQLSLFSNEKQDKLDKAIDILKDKYGFNKIKRAGDLFIDGNRKS